MWQKRFMVRLSRSFCRINVWTDDCRCSGLKSLKCKVITGRQLDLVNREIVMLHGSIQYLAAEDEVLSLIVRSQMQQVQTMLFGSWRHR